MRRTDIPQTVKCITYNVFLLNKSFWTELDNNLHQQIYVSNNILKSFVK